ncbi:MAG: hypothetical protein JSV53_10515 [candidate division WOR-3 bacterium]|nr:MAG: hypothetical protein JSV53_10515 [candidate division WOR-3 bacterium]
MHSKVLCVLLSICVGSLAFAGKPEITNNGTFYIYSFFWQNADFNPDTEDGDQFFYMHADVGIMADFGAGVSSQVTLGGWGTFGKHPITGAGEECPSPGQDVAVREAYIDFAKLFDSPLSFRAGKMHVLQGEQVFDGGEDGVMGAKFYGSTEMVDYDFAWYRLEENGGCWYVGAVSEVPDDVDLFGAWITGKFLEGAFRVAPYWFWRTTSGLMMIDTLEYVMKDDPMWLGGRLDVGPIAGLTVNGEFTMMMGQAEVVDVADSEMKYKGMHALGRLSYAPPTLPITFGGAYVMLTGDKVDTLAEYEAYESPIMGPYTFGFYKWWPGFGPAHVQTTAYGFSLVAPFIDMMSTNLNVINANIGFHQGPFMLRGDFFMYSRNWVPDGVESDMGMEIALLTTYTYRKTITLGATGGYWMPGDYFGDDLDPMLGGYLFTYITF